MVLTTNAIHCCYCLKKTCYMYKLFYSEAMYYFNVSSSFSLATTDSSNLISKAVVVWSLIENALTLQGWNAKQLSSTSLFNYEPTYKIHNHFYYFPTALYRSGLDCHSVNFPQYSFLWDVVYVCPNNMPSVDRLFLDVGMGQGQKH